MKKSFLSLLLCALLLAGCALGKPTPGDPAATKTFTDSLGRTVTVPEKITKIAVTGPLSQVYILPLAGHMLAGVSNAFARDAEIYLSKDLLAKPEIGQLYGGKAEMDLEALLNAAPEVVIDIGEPKGTMREDLDELTKKTGIPFVHIDATTTTAPDAYRMLGQLLGLESKAEALALWCEKTLDTIRQLMHDVDAAGARKTILYCLGDRGTNVMAEGSFHADTINLLGSNAAKLAEVVHHGDGNEVDLEQILLWNPEVIFFAPGSCYDTVGGNPQWQALDAIKNGTYYKEPYGPYGWLSSPPAVQRYLGMLWLGWVLYPDFCAYDLQQEVTGYYKLFYGCTLTDDMYAALIKNGI